MSETIGTARLDVVVDTSSLEVGIERAKRSVSGMSTQAQAEYAKLNAAEKRRVDSLKRQADMLGLSREQQLAYNVVTRTSGTVQEELLKRIQKTNTGLASGAKQFDQYGMSARQSAMAMRQLPMQLTDITVGLATGQKPMMVLLQQGGQLKDLFGGIVPAARALSGALLGLINPFTVTAGAVAAFALAFEQGRDQMREFEKALVMSGNAAQVNAGKLEEYARKLDSISGVTQRGASAVLAEVAATGKFTGDQIMQVADAALRMREATGREISATIADFAKLKDGPAEAIVALSLAAGDGTNAVRFLTTEQQRNIATLQEQGKEVEATQAAFDVYASTIQQRAPGVTEQFGLMEGAIKGIKNTAAEAWDAVVQGIGQADQAMLRFVNNNQRTIASALQAVPGFGGLGPNLQSLIGLATTRAPAKADFSNVISGDLYGEAQKKADKERKDAEEDFARLVEGNLDKRQKLEAEIVSIRETGVKAGRTEAEIQAQIAAARQRYAESLPKGPKGSKTDPTENILATLRQQISLNNTAAESEDRLSASEAMRVRILTQLDELGGKVTAGRRAEIEALLQQLTVSDQLAQAKEDERKARKDQEREDERAAEAKRRNMESNAQLVSDMQFELSLLRMTHAEREREIALRMLSKDATLEQRAAVATLADELNKASKQDMAWSSAQNDLVDAMEDVAFESKNAKEAILDFFESLARQMFRMMAEDWAGQLMKMFRGTGQQQSTSQNVWGAALGAALGGYSGGGYTGPGGMNQPAGVVHKGEVVWSQHDVARAGGVGAVEAMRLGLRGYASGGVVGMPSAAGGGVNVNVFNAPEGTQVNERRNSGGGFDIDVILKAVDQHIGGSVASGSGATYSAFKGRFGLREAI